MEIGEGLKARLVGLALVGSLLAGNMALATGPWLVILADTGPVSAWFWRLFLALPFLVVLARVNGQRLGGMPRKTLILVGSALVLSRIAAPSPNGSTSNGADDMMPSSKGAN